MGESKMRYEKHKRKKRKSTSIVLVLLVLFGATAGYVSYQYKQGVNQSLEKINNGSTENICQ